MNPNGASIAIITGRGKADAYLATELKKQYPDAKIIRYQVKKIRNLQYYFDKLFRIGVWTSVSIKMISLYFRVRTLIQKMLDVLSAKKQDAQTQDYEIVYCDNAESLYDLTKDYDHLFITQSLRLRDKFFRKGRYILQINGGRYPQYSGDTAIFWAWATSAKADLAFSIILRSKYFRNSRLLRYCPITLREKETLNSLRYKGVISVVHHLPALFEQVFGKGDITALADAGDPIHLNAPTLWTYLAVTKFGKKLKSIPRYAYR